MSNDRRPQPPRRRWLRALLLASAAFTALLVALPLWLPWAALPLLHGQGVTVREWERHGAVRLELRGLAFSNATVQLDVAHVFVQWPHRWLLDRLRAAPAGAPQAEAEGWTLRLTDAPRNADADGGSLSAALDAVLASEETLRPWLRRIVATGGRIEWDGPALEIPLATLASDGLAVNFTARDPQLAGTLTLAARPVAELRLALAEANHSIALETVWSRAADAWIVDGGLQWRGQRARLDGRIAPGGWLPETLSLAATNWTLPAALTPWPAGGDWSGGFALGWTNGQYSFAARARAQPPGDMPFAHEHVEVDLAGGGTFEALLLERLVIATPVLDAALSQPLAFAFDGRLLVPEAALTVRARISEREKLPFTAALDGTLRVRATTNDTPHLTFALHAAELAAAGVTVRDAALDGTLLWPVAALSELSFELPGAGRTRVRGNVDLAARTLDGVGWSFEGSIPPTLLDGAGAVDGVTARGTLAGTWPALTHRTELRTGAARWRGFTADAVAADAEGALAGTNAFRVQLSAGPSELSLAGALDLAAWKERRAVTLLDSLTLAAGTNAPAVLVRPVEASFRWPATNAADVPRFELSVSPVEIRRGDGRLQLSGATAWPQRGEVALAAANVTTDDIAAFWPGRMPQVGVREWTLAAAWTNGPLRSSSRLDAAWRAEPDLELALTADVRADADGLRVERATVRQDGRDVAELSGTLPVVIRPAAAEPFAWRPDARFAAKAVTTGGGFIERELARRTGWNVESLHAAVDASGSPNAPSVSVQLGAASVRPGGFTNVPGELLSVSNVVIEADATRGGVTLRRGAFELAGRPATVSGSLPLDAGDWAEVWRQIRTPDWQEMEAALDVADLPVGAFAPWLGDVLTPAGRATARVRLEPGGRLGGEISITNVTTRAFEPLGSLRDISGVVAFAGRRATLHGLNALLGGQPVRLGGSAGWDAAGIADLALALTATNIALVRSPEFFLRSDLDVRLLSTNREPPLLTGEVRLRESLFFQDLAALTRVDLNQPELRPPYFSIRTPPLDRWRLDLRVTGRRFLKVISPVFRGDVTAGLQLRGTLREPQASGEVTVEDGRMTFPFGTLDLSGGAVRFTQREPHRPQLDFHAGGMNFGYQIQAHLAGTPDAPNLTFTSVPPLTTRQILLMLSAGEIPGGTFEFSDADKASRLGFYLGKQMINEVLGLDGTDDRLNIRTGEHVTSDGRLTYNLEYRLSERFFVFGEYSRFRDYNGGLKFKVFSR